MKPAPAAAAPILNEHDLAFLRYEFLDTEALPERQCHAGHTREVLDATLATARRIAEERFAPHLAVPSANHLR